MKTTHKILLCIALAIAVFLSRVLVGREAIARRIPHSRPDTVVVSRTETITIVRPVERLRTLIRHDTVWLPVVNNVKVSPDTANRLPFSMPDTVQVALPIHRVRYTDDSTFVAVVSGHRARLDSLVWLRHDNFATVRAPCAVASAPRIVVSVGPQAGFYRTPVGWQPGVGVGISVGVTLRLGGRERK